MSFNFENDTLSIYHNDIYAGTTLLESYTAIIPAFSLYTTDIQLEVTKCEFDWK